MSFYEKKYLKYKEKYLKLRNKSKYILDNNYSTQNKVFHVDQNLLTPQNKKEITDFLNIYRKRHGASPVVWDDTVTRFSQTWAEYLSKNNKGMIHSNSGNNNVDGNNIVRTGGENLYYSQSMPPTISEPTSNEIVTHFKKAINAWYDEIKDYDFNTHKKSSSNAVVGHFTALVWKKYNTFGMGFSRLNDNNTTKIIVSFNTDIPTNLTSTMNGIEQEGDINNVLPPVNNDMSLLSITDKILPTSSESYQPVSSQPVSYSQPNNNNRKSSRNYDYNQPQSYGYQPQPQSYGYQPQSNRYQNNSYSNQSNSYYGDDV